VKVKVLETDEKGRIKLSMKALIERPEGMPEERLEPRGDRPPRRDRDDRPRRERSDRDDRPREPRAAEAVPAEVVTEHAAPLVAAEAPKQPE
jgi:polyribonucleotide nucleotidyltransferase